MKNDLVEKATEFRDLHHTGKLLILPNIWDALGAKLLEQQGFKAIATASASVAFSQGYHDGQKIGFEEILLLLKKICNNTSLPVSADLERGYAHTNKELAENIKRVIDCGVAGLNIEDSNNQGDQLLSVDEQCEKINVIRKASREAGIPIVINARTDIFLKQNYPGSKIEDAIARGKSYIDSGADCFYPILCSNDDLKQIKSKLNVPLNVLAISETLPMNELEALGIARLSLGPSLLKSALTKMKEVMTSLKNYNGYDSFTNEHIMTTHEIENLIDNSQRNKIT